MQDIETPDNPNRGVSWLAGQAPSDINDSARAKMARQAAARDTLLTETGLMDPQEAAAGFPELLRARCSTALHAFVERASRRRMISPSEYIRQSLTKTLIADGLDPAAAMPTRDAGALYDVINGQKRHALVTPAGAILSMGYHEAKPAPDDRGVWVPVAHLDSEPFDIAQHWRLKPVYTIFDTYGTPDRVECVYPVIPKSLEAM